MKSKYVVLASALLISLSTFAQKDELKALKKIYGKEEPSSKDVIDYKANLVKVQSSATEEGDKVYANFYQSMLPIIEMQALGKAAKPEQVMKLVTPKSITDLAAGLNATLDYEKKTGKKVYTDDINETIVSYKPMLLQYAVALGTQKQYKEGAEVLYVIYQLDKKDPEKLYYASSFAVNGQDYDLALQYYDELKKVNYSGEGTIFWAKNMASGTEESFPTKADRDRYIALKTHGEARDEKLPSKRGEIYKNIALIYVQKGKVDEAKAAVAEARRLNPDDTSLILTEADLYLKAKDYATYEKLVNEALQKNPNDTNLIYNLGVISGQSGKPADAEKYYKKVIEIDPKYTNAYLNLAILKLDPEKSLIDQMNKLGTSAADNKKYEVLKKQRLDVFTSAIPYLEKAVELDSQNYEAARTLLNVYNALEITDKAKALKVKVREMEATQTKQ